MKVKYLILAVLAVGFSVQTAISQNNNTSADVEVFESVLSTASWAGFKYEEQLALAKKGDHKATLKLLEFSGTVDGKAALDHSVTLLELIAAGGDLGFSAAVNMSKPKLKKVLLDRLQLAQGRTKKEALRKPIAEWAPTTWEVLNGRPFAPKIKAGEEKSCMDLVPHQQKPQASIPAEPTPIPDVIAPDSMVPDPGAPSIAKPKGKQ